MPDQWENLTVADLVPAFVPTLASGVSTAASGVATILDVAAALAETASAFIVDVTDPIAAVTDTIISQINDEITDLMNTGVYFTAVVPKTLSDKKGIDSVLRMLVRSLDDDRDPNRPQFGSGESVGAIVLAAGGASIPDLTDAVELLNAILNIKEIEEFLDMANPVYQPETTPFPDGGGAVTSIPSGRNPKAFFTDLGRTEQVDKFKRLRIQFLSGRNINETTQIQSFDPSTRTFEVGELPYTLAVGDLYQIISPQGGRYPDWTSKKVANIIPELGVIFTALQSMTKLLAAGVAASQAADDFIAAIENKATQLQDIATEIEDAVTALTAILAGSGVSILRLAPETGGNDGLAGRLLAASDAPDFDDDTHYTVAAAVVADEASYAVLEIIFG